LVADTIVRTVAEMPESGKLGLVDRIELFSGGCASNAAIDMARLGLSVAIIGKTGRDGFGGFLAGVLRDAGVDAKGLVSDGGASTSASVALIEAGGERSFLHSYGANGLFSIGDVDFGVIAESRVVFVAGAMLMPTFDGGQCAELLRRAKGMGKMTVLDTAWDAKGRWMDLLRPCMGHIDLFMPSVDEARMLSGENEPESMADAFLAMGVGTAVIKLGGDGCLIKGEGARSALVCPTYSQYKAVDTTGAGDSFVSGFLTGLSKGWDMARCAVLANAVGTHCVMHPGSSTGIRGFADTVSFIEGHEVPAVRHADGSTYAPASGVWDWGA